MIGYLQFISLMDGVIDTLAEAHLQCHIDLTPICFVLTAGKLFKAGSFCSGLLCLCVCQLCTLHRCSIVPAEG